MCTYIYELAYIVLRICICICIYIYEQNIKLCCNKPRAGSSSKFKNELYRDGKGSFRSKHKAGLKIKIRRVHYIM